ncbi:hypothetical protein [Xylophilus sp. Leaf220]|uniref:putative signal transducing protein n=1 Tax=Xylophilus sp. Leaf220 TaxID=1735686 RepID=UPI0006FDA243|nr:hypothetical protein [Xylophilus sp. Leaf220]KQM70107.1 hypothetical protein ASE76_09840 [Xylophilus sp. Leaf220]
MIRIAQAPNAAIATVWADLLCEAGYPASIQRLFLGSAAGELAPGDCLPEIWVRHDEHAAAARTLLDQLQALPQRRWACPGCGEAIEGGFEECWNCGAPMPRG